MIEFVIAFINQRLTALNFFEEVKGLAQLIEREAETEEGNIIQSFPAVYCDNGEYKFIDDLTEYGNGLAYHRLLDEVNGDGEGEAVTACDKVLRKTFEMRLVALVPKRIFDAQNDDKYIDQKIINNIENAIFASNEPAIANTLKVDVVSIQTNSSDADRYSVFREEHEEVKFNIGFEYAYVAVNYTVAIEATQSCFQNFDCEGLTDPIFCESTVNDANNPDTPILLSNGDEYTCIPGAPIDELTCQQLNDGLNQAQRQIIQRVGSLVTGQTASFHNNDDGARRDGRGADWFTLNCNNPFGNTRRFTDENGLQVYGNNYIIDHQSKLAWYRVVAQADWEDSWTAIEALNVLGFTDFFMPNMRQLYDVSYMQVDRPFNYAPFNLASFPNFWSSSDLNGLGTSFYHITSASQISQAPKGQATNRYIACRVHYT